MGSVTAICGPSAVSGTGSPNCVESRLPQAPAEIIRLRGVKDAAISGLDAEIAAYVFHD